MPIRLHPQTELEYIAKEQEIKYKLYCGTPLSIVEEYINCECLPDSALLGNKCLDEFYTRLFWQTRPEYWEEIQSINRKKELQLRFEMFAFEVLLSDWARQVFTKTTVPLLHYSNIETRKELSQLFNNHILTTSSKIEYERRKAEIIAWSKYRYIVAKKVADLCFPNNEYVLYFDNKAVVLDLKGLMHIIVVHFGAIMKLYPSDKTHFEQYFHPEDLHLQLKKIFFEIDKSGLYNGKLKRDSAINFKHTNQIYQVYCGKGDNGRLRIKTFYPADEKRSNDISTKNKEYILTANLSLFL